jgi:hypothetical protein
MIKDFAIYLLVTSLTLGACDKGALKCSSKNEALICDPSNNYYLSDTTCVSSTLTNCASITQTGECLLCEANFYLESNSKKCISVEIVKQVVNCLLYRNAQTCIRCAKNFYVKDSKCAAVTKTVDNCDTYSDDGKCVICSAGFLFNAPRDGCVAIPSVSKCSAYSFIDCKACAPGYTANQNLYLVDFQTSFQSIQAEVSRFITSSFADWTPLYRCQKIEDLNCLSVSAFNVCKTCKESYFLTADKTCQPFPRPIIEACLTYVSLNACSRCQSGYFLESSLKCTLIAGDKQITDCVDWNSSASTVQCTQCSASKYLSSNSCTSNRVDSVNIASCKTTAISADSCATCNDGFVLTNDGKKCLAAIPKCSEYNISSISSTVLTCKTCFSAFYLSTFDRVTICVAGAIEGCLTCSSPTVCIACNTVSYYLTNTICVKHVKVDNCSAYSGTSYNECATCNVGFFPFKYSMTCLAITVITNCATYADRNSCLNCTEGYFIRSNICLAITSTYANCLTAARDSTECGTCQDKYSKKSLFSDKTCTLNHDYILQQCDSVTAGQTFKVGNVVDDNGCKTCKDNAYPWDLSNLIGCVSETLIATRGVTTAISNCKVYNADAIPKCLVCAQFIRVAQGNIRTCIIACLLTETNLIDNLKGTLNSCSLMNGGLYGYSIDKCAIAITYYSAEGTSAMSCIKTDSAHFLYITADDAVIDNASLYRGIESGTSTRPADGFLYYGFDPSISTNNSNEHISLSDPAKECELYIFTS